MPEQDPPSGAQAESSSTVRPATPPQNNSNASGSGSGSGSAQTALVASRKRRSEDDQDDEPAVKKEEPRDERISRNLDWDTPSRASRVVKYEIIDDVEYDSDDDVIEISPFKRHKGDGDIRSYLGGGSFHRRQRSESPSPLPPPEPFYHPEFPERPPLRCPNRNQQHTRNAGIVCEAAGTSRNKGREYYRCAACPGFGGFICWADGRGIHADNPRCDCGYAAREDITGENSTQPNTIWYKCATNACSFRRYEWDDPLDPAEVNAYYGREVYRL